MPYNKEQIGLFASAAAGKSKQMDKATGEKMMKKVHEEGSTAHPKRKLKRKHKK